MLTPLEIFENKIEEARKRVRDMDEIDACPHVVLPIDMQLGTILSAMECTLKNASDKTAIYDAYVMLDNLYKHLRKK